MNVLPLSALLHPSFSALNLYSFRCISVPLLVILYCFFCYYCFFKVRSGSKTPVTDICLPCKHLSPFVRNYNSGYHHFRLDPSLFYSRFFFHSFLFCILTFFTLLTRFFFIFSARFFVSNDCLHCFPPLSGGIQNRENFPMKKNRTETKNLL